MSGAVRRYLADLREGFRILRGREFWRTFRAYWSPDALAARMNRWVEQNKRPRT